MLVSHTTNCLQYMYPYCCANTAKCSNVGLDLNTVCTDVNTVPTQVRFSDKPLELMLPCQEKQSGRHFQMLTLYQRVLISLSTFLKKLQTRKPVKLNGQVMLSAYT